MPGHDVMVLGASAGGVEALTQLVRNLPPDLPASLFVVLHIRAHGTSLLPGILNRKGALTAVHPVRDEPIVPGRVYVAPPDQHLLVHRGWVRLARGPRENGHRPAIDPLFRSAAVAYGPRVVGVLLSGTLDDGTAGLDVIKRRGGVAIVQDPDEALYPGMIRNAMENVAIDHRGPVAEIAVLLQHLAHESVADLGALPLSEELKLEAEMDPQVFHQGWHPGAPSGFACPDCGGTLWELQEGDLIRFRCRVGHAWTGQSLVAEQSDALETALWTALRALEERAALALRLAQRFQKRGYLLSARRFEQQAEESRQRAEVLRQVLERGPTTVDDADADVEDANPALNEGTSDG